MCIKLKNSTSHAFRLGKRERYRKERRLVSPQNLIMVYRPYVHSFHFNIWSTEGKSQLTSKHMTAAAALHSVSPSCCIGLCLIEKLVTCPRHSNCQ